MGKHQNAYYLYVAIETGQNSSTWFNESTGCAGYVAVIESVSGSAVTISPDEKILYDPANAPTGGMCWLKCQF